MPPTALPAVATGQPEDWFVLAVILGASVLGPLFLAVRNRHPDGVHSPPLAWLRAGLYFSVVLVASWATGVLGTLARAPWVAPGQAGQPLWLGLTALWALVTAWAYGYWWPRGTLTHGRPLVLLPQLGFGLAWGFCSGQLTLVFWALLAGFGGAPWLTAVGVLVVLSGTCPSSSWDSRTSRCSATRGCSSPSMPWRWPVRRWPCASRRSGRRTARRWTARPPSACSARQGCSASQ